MRQDQKEFYIRVALKAIESTGANPENVIAYEFASDKERYTAWAAESILYALRAKDPIAMFRGYKQALEERGRLGGFLPGGGVLSDALIELQHDIENAIKGEP